jgi:tetratricopeptide (TPR) repeat protein
MSIFTSIKKKTTVTAAIRQIAKARKETDKNKANALYKSAYEGFEFVLSDNLMLADALYHWGLGLLNQAKLSENTEEAITFYEEAIAKYTFCSIVEPFYLGATLESGVAYMDIARLKSATAEDELYQRAKKYFDRAGEIQKGSGAYNLACLYSIANNDDACLEMLKMAREFDHLPVESDILNDPDMENSLQKPWLLALMDEVKNEQAMLEKAAAERKKAKADAKLRAGGATNIGNTPIEAAPSPEAKVEKPEASSPLK